LIKVLNDENYKDLILQGTTPSFLVFYTKTCHPCKVLENLISTKINEYAEKNNVDILSCDITKNKKIKEKFQVISVPLTISITKSRKFQNILFGVKNIEEYFKAIDDIT